MSLAALQRAASEAVSRSSAQRDTSSKCTMLSVPRTVDSHQSKRQMLGVGFAAAAVFATSPMAAVAGEEKGNRAIRFSGNIKDAQAKRAAREAEVKEKIAALKAGAQ